MPTTSHEYCVPSFVRQKFSHLRIRLLSASQRFSAPLRLLPTALSTWCVVVSLKKHRNNATCHVMVVRNVKHRLPGVVKLQQGGQDLVGTMSSAAAAPVGNQAAGENAKRLSLPLDRLHRPRTSSAAASVRSVRTSYSVRSSARLSVRKLQISCPHTR